MTSLRRYPVGSWPLAALLGSLSCTLPAQTIALPPTAPTQAAGVPSTQGIAPARTSHAARVSCTGGRLEVDANNSSLNQILRSVAHCTGLRVTGAVPEQRVFGTYGPAAPATVLGTLLDGTGSNMLLLEAANGQPAQLILTPRTGGPTSPSAFTGADSSGSDNDAAAQDSDDALPQAGNSSRGSGAPFRPQASPSTFGQPAAPLNQSQGYVGGVQGNPGSPVTSPPALPIGNNNVLGSPDNRSPDAATLPTTNSVPLDAVATPSTTTPSASGIVQAPNPPAAGSDTAAALNGSPAGTPGTSTITPGPGATGSNSNGAQQPSSDLTPEQVFQQLQQRLQQQQQQQQQQEQQQQGQPAKNPQ